MRRHLLLVWLVSIAALMPPAAVSANEGEDASVAILQASPMDTLGDGFYDAFSFGRMGGLLVQLAFLFIALTLLERLFHRLGDWRPAVGTRFRRLLPTIRLAFAALACLLVILAVTPDHPMARAVVVGGIAIAVLWSARDVLRNGAAGAVLIARRAVRVGEWLRVGEHEGQVVSITLRGVELEADDGTHTFVPGLRLHTEAATHAAGHARAAPLTIHCMIPPTVDLPPETIATLSRRLALLSPRRAPASPVVAEVDAATGDLRLTATPFDHQESQAMAAELIRRLREALAPPVEPPPTEPNGAG